MNLMLVSSYYEKAGRNKHLSKEDCVIVDHQIPYDGSCNPSYGPGRYNGFIVAELTNYTTE